MSVHFDRESLRAVSRGLLEVRKAHELIAERPGRGKEVNLGKSETLLQVTFLGNLPCEWGAEGKGANSVGAVFPSELWPVALWPVSQERRLRRFFWLQQTDSPGVRCCRFALDKALVAGGWSGGPAADGGARTSSALASLLLTAEIKPFRWRQVKVKEDVPVHPGLFFYVPTYVHV